jgi:hypothetical protein
MWGCIESICVGKTGLGRKNFLTEKRSKVKVLEAKNLSDFRLRKQATLAQHKCKSDLRKSRLACHQLDGAGGLAAPLKNWYWPEELLPKVDEETDSDSDNGDEELDDDEVQVLHVVYGSCMYCIPSISPLSNLKRLLVIFVAHISTAFGVELLTKVNYYSQV